MQIEKRTTNESSNKYGFYNKYNPPEKKHQNIFVLNLISQILNILYFTYITEVQNNNRAN